MTADISVCMLARDEAGSEVFEECLKSVRPHVAEVVVVDTGSKDATVEIAKRYADVVESYSGCNDPVTGLIVDFADARRRSFELATKNWTMWIDSDDVLIGGEKLARLIELADKQREGNAWCFLFPYEYAYDAAGECVMRHYRERLLSDRTAMRWVNPVHEVLVPAPERVIGLAPCDDVVWSHQRHRVKRVPEPGRNLRIMKRIVEEKGSDDARHFYYLGLEYANTGALDEAVKWLTRYVDVSGWDDERTMACLKLVDVYFARGDLRAAIDWGFRAIQSTETWAEGYFALAKAHYGLAMQGGPNERRNWERCAHFAKQGLALPPTRTMLFINPLEREHEIHVYLNMALGRIGDVQGALDSCFAGLRKRPDDAHLLHNRKLYECTLARGRAHEAVAKLREHGEMAELTARLVDAFVEKQAEAHQGPASGPWPTSPEAPKEVSAASFPRARVAPHPQAWMVPEAQEEFGALPLRTSDAQLLSLTLAVWKEYMLHDEVLAAERFLADAPYRVKHHVDVERALALTRKSVAWMSDAVEEQKANQPADTTIENGVPLPHELSGQLKTRSDLAISSAKPGDKIVDFGCFDGAMTNRWALAGHDVTGVDLCLSSVAMANRKAAEFKTGARHVAAHFSEAPHLLDDDFTLVTCTDVYEHVKDPVRDILSPAMQLLGPDGRVAVVTPNGAWMRGEFVPWAHPWRWAQEKGKPWLCDENRAHLVAPTPWTVAENMRRAGFWVKESRVVPCVPADVPGQSHVYAEGRVRGPFCEKPLDVAIVCGRAWEEWTPASARAGGIGGSETAVIEVGKRLAAAGHRVRVFTDCGAGEGIYDGVEYHRTEKVRAVEGCDVLVAWRSAAHLEAVSARLKLLWVHDIFATEASHRALLQADRVLALSGWHKAFLEQHHNLPPDQVLRTRNGIDLARFDLDVPRDPKKAVYSSSPDRGLMSLLQMWPRIRERVPGAELHVFYGFETWRASARGNAPMLEAIDFLEGMTKQTEGVVTRGRVDQDTLAREFLSAGAWLYPTWFTETSCITAMEAQAAGCRIVTSPIAALRETVNERGVLVEGDWLSKSYQDAFIEAAVEAMSPEDPDGDREYNRAHARANFGWDTLVTEWELMMRSHLDALRVEPLVPYRAAKGFSR